MDSIMYSDPALIDTIVGELKSQGTFDQFRKECIADVDTKPAYQNLHQRVETTVSNFLDGRTWRSDLNKNQLRDSLRKHILEMGFLDTGVERIVDQVVNPKVHAVFMPHVEDVVYRVQGIPKPDKKSTPNASTGAGSTSKTGGVFSTSIFNQPPPFLPGLSFLPPALQSHMQKAPTLADLLPTDLDPVSSPESSKDSDIKDKFVNSNMAQESGIVQHHDDSMESQLSGISDLTSHGSDRAASVKSGRRGSVPCDDTNQDLSNTSLKNKVLNELEEPKSHKAEECVVTHSETENQLEAENTLKTTFEDGCGKSSYSSGSVMHYGEQYSLEEEVATTINNPHYEVSHEVSIKVETDPGIDEKKKLSGIIDSIEKNVSEEGLPETKTEFATAVQHKYEPSDYIGSNPMDDNSLAQSEDSQFSGSSDNKLHIDEMKDFNSQSDNSHQNEDDRSGMKTSSEGFLSEDSSKPKTIMENVVEASEEARHGFDDSQDALERPPLPSTPPAPPQDLIQPPPLPPLPPLDSSSDLDENPPPSSSPVLDQPSISESLDHSKDEFDHTVEGPPQTPPLPIIPGPGSVGNSFTPAKAPDEEQNSIGQKPFSSTPPLADSPNFEECPPLPPTPGTMDYPPLPPATPPLAECPPLPPTPPLPEILNVTERPPLPPTPPLPLPDQSQLLPTPPLGHRLGLSECPPLPQAKELSVSVSGPPALPEDEFSQDSNMSPSYDEGAIPKTPQWEPRFPSAEDTKHPLSSFEFLGISDPNKIQRSFIPATKSNLNEPDDASQSDSEEMQLAWSPLSTHDSEMNEDSKGKQSSRGLEISSKESINQESTKETGGHSSDRHREVKGDDKQRSSESDKHRERDRVKDTKSKERRKDDGRFHKESTGSNKKQDETKHKESRDRRDSSSKSRHDDKSRSGRDRDRHSSSSHHRSDDKRKDEKRDDKEKSSSSKHKSSHSDDRHRHRDKDYKSSSSGSTSGRHEDKTQEKSSKSEEKSRTWSKSHSSDRDRRDQERKERDAKDRDRKSDKEKDRYRKESSRHDEKRKMKEREKDKKDKSSNVCRPRNERKSSDPDSNNGSMFGGNNQASSEGVFKSNQYQDGNNQSNDKGSRSVDSNSKSSETSQTNNCCVDSLLSPTSNQVCPSSSLPFKKRPLLPECDSSDARLESSSGQLLLKIKKSKSCTNVTVNLKRRKLKALRKLESISISSLDNCPEFTMQAYDANASPLPQLSGSPTQYLETDWPTKSDDEAFLAYVEGLERSKTLSDLSDFSQSDSEEEEILKLDGFNNESALEGRNVKLSLTILAEDEVEKLVKPFIEVGNSKRKEKKMSQPKASSSSVKAKTRPRPKKILDDDVEVKRLKINSKDVAEITPVEPKSRRARKPNKRYSNDEFTSHFDYEEDLEQSQDELQETHNMVERIPTEKEDKVIFQSHDEAKSLAQDFSTIENMIHASTNHPDEVKENSNCASVENQTEQSSYSWNRDSYNSNSEDETDNTNNESDLIGTALKNLMMESGLGGPVEASSFQKSASNPHPKVSESLGRNQKSIPLSGVKRVGLSKNYRGGKKFSAKPAMAAIACSEFSFPPTPDSDVSASSFEKGSPEVK